MLGYFAQLIVEGKLYIIRSHILVLRRGRNASSFIAQSMVRLFYCADCPFLIVSLYQN